MKRLKAYFTLNNAIKTEFNKIEPLPFQNNLKIEGSNLVITKLLVLHKLESRISLVFLDFHLPSKSRFYCSVVSYTIFSNALVVAKLMAPPSVSF